MDNGSVWEAQQSPRVARLFYAVSQARSSGLTSAVRFAFDIGVPACYSVSRICNAFPEAVMFARAGAEVSGFDISENVIPAIEALARREGLGDRIAVRAAPDEQPMTYADIRRFTAPFAFVCFEECNLLAVAD